MWIEASRKVAHSTAVAKLALLALLPLLALLAKRPLLPLLALLWQLIALCILLQWALYNAVNCVLPH